MIQLIFGVTLTLSSVWDPFYFLFWAASGSTIVGFVDLLLECGDHFVKCWWGWVLTEYYNRIPFMVMVIGQPLSTVIILDHAWDYLQLITEAYYVMPRFTLWWCGFLAFIYFSPTLMQWNQMIEFHYRFDKKKKFTVASGRSLSCVVGEAPPPSGRGC